MALFGDVLAPACISSDSPRFLAFIPERADQGVAALRRRGLRVRDRRRVVDGGERRGLRGEPGAALGRRSRRAARRARAAASCPAARPATSRRSSPAREAAAARRGATGRRAGGSRSATRRTRRSTTRSGSWTPTPLVVPTGDDDRLDRRRRCAPRSTPIPTRTRCSRSSRTGGTTNTGQIDDLDGIAAVAHERGLWFHVDGAYGLAALAAPSVRDRFRGIEHADSLVVDPHKWLFAPFDCAALLYRDPELARRAHSQHAAYLDPIADRRRVEPVRLRVPPHPARPRPPVLVLARGARHRRVHDRDRADARDRARRGAPASTPRRTSSSSVEPELTVVLWRRPGWTAGGLRDLVAAAARRPARVRPADDLARRDRRPRRVPPPRLPARGHRRHHRLDALTHTVVLASFHPGDMATRQRREDWSHDRDRSRARHRPAGRLLGPDLPGRGADRGQLVPAHARDLAGARRELRPSRTMRRSSTSGVGPPTSSTVCSTAASPMSRCSMSRRWRSTSCAGDSGGTTSVEYLHADVLSWRPTRRYQLWHDRAVFHFLVDASDRRRYLDTMRAALALDGLAIIATFAQDGPERCSGLPVARYSAEALSDLLGSDFVITATREQRHITPTGHAQPFTWVAARRASSA